MLHLVTEDYIGGLRGKEAIPPGKRVRVKKVKEVKVRKPKKPKPPISMRMGAKTLGIDVYVLFNTLRRVGVLMEDSTLPCQKYIDKGYFTVVHVDTGEWAGLVTKITPEGLLFIARNWQCTVKKWLAWQEASASINAHKT